MQKLLVLGPASSIHLQNWVKPFLSTYKCSYDVHIITFHAPSSETSFSGATIHKIKSVTGTKLDYLLKIKEIEKIVRTIQPDVIHAQYASSYGVVCSFLKYNCKKILSVWGSDILVARNILPLRILIDRSLKTFDIVNVPSLSLADIVHSLGVPKNKILIFQYGIDIDVLDQLQVSKGTSDQVQIISTRNWNPIYNIDRVIAGFLLAAKVNDNLTLKLIGSGNADDEDRVKSLTSSHENIQVIGRLPMTELVHQLWKSDVFISIPESDGMSLSVLEAMYTGCYPVLSQIPPNIEILDNGDGVLCDQKSDNAICEGILKAVVALKGFDPQKNRAIIGHKANYKKNISIIEQKYRDL
jgi:glycosyltransferase involved in cell wall biosynthesis